MQFKQLSDKEKNNLMDFVHEFTKMCLDAEFTVSYSRTFNEPEIRILAGVCIDGKPDEVENFIHVDAILDNNSKALARNYFSTLMEAIITSEGKRRMINNRGMN